MAQDRYSQVRIPEEMHIELKRKAEERGHPLSFLARMAISTAARLVVEGHGGVLPKESPSLDAGWKNVQWAETKEDAAEAVALIGRAGSSRPAVMAWFVQAYLEADGSLVRMNWPFPGHSLSDAA